MRILCLTGPMPICKGNTPAPPGASFRTSDGRVWQVQEVRGAVGWRVISTDVDGQKLAMIVSTPEAMVTKAEAACEALRLGRAPPFGTMRKPGALPLPEALRAA